MSQIPPVTYKLCITSVDNKSTAKDIAMALLQEQLAACVNIVGKVISMYQWQGEIVEDQEQLLLIKTDQSHVEAVGEKIAALHPYDEPEFIVLPIESGSESYLEWISECLQAKD